MARLTGDVLFENVELFQDRSKQLLGELVDYEDLPSPGWIDRTYSFEVFCGK